MRWFHTYHWVVLITLPLSLSFHATVWALFAHEPKTIAASGGVISVEIGDAADYIKNSNTGQDTELETQDDKNASPKPPEEKPHTPLPSQDKKITTLSKPTPPTPKPVIITKPAHSVETIPTNTTPIQYHKMQPIQESAQPTPQNKSTTSDIVKSSNAIMPKPHSQNSTHHTSKNTAKNPSSVIQKNTGKSTTASLPGNPDIPISEDVSARYGALVTRHLRRRKKPKASQPGAVFINFQLNRDGTIRTIKVSKSSGSKRFDRDALRYVKRASPFPKAPKSARLHFNIRVRGS